MARVTLRILDGADRGQVYENLVTPITIGREEGNSVELNDERVSRFHVKIQEDDGNLVLTDVDSTNGTKVNGETVRLRILRFGDVIALGRSVLLFGSRDQIAGRLAALRGKTLPAGIDPDDESSPGIEDPSALDLELGWDSEDDELMSALHLYPPPELPDRLTPVQAAQLSELVEYLHIRIRRLLGSVSSSADTEGVTLNERRWQDLVDLQSRLAEYLRDIGEPG